MEILENGIDSLKKSLRSLNEIDSVEEINEFELKDIIIQLHNSIETLAKYLVSEKNEYLIYGELNKAFEKKINKKINNGDDKIKMKTIEFMDAINRLFILYDRNIDSNSYNQIKRFNEIRNDLVHYKTDFNINEIRHLISNILKIVMPIFSEKIENLKKHLKLEGLNEDIKDIYIKDELWVLKEIFKIIIDLNICDDKIKSTNGKDIEKIFISKKNDNISYTKCDICLEDCFVETDLTFVDGEIIYNLGHCNFCGFNKTKEVIFINRNFINDELYEKAKENNELDILYKSIFEEKLIDFHREHYKKDEKISDLRKILLNDKIIFTEIVRGYLRDYSSKAKDILETKNMDNSLNLYELLEKYSRICTMMSLYFQIFEKKDFYNWKDKIFVKNYQEDSESIEKDALIDNASKEIEILIKERINKGEKLYDVINGLLRKSNICFDQKNDIDIIYLELFDSITSSNIWGILAGQWLSHPQDMCAIIDRVSDVGIIEVYFVNQKQKDTETITYLLIECGIDTETYLGEGEYYYNGSDTIFVELKAIKTLDNICKIETKLIGME